VFGGGSEGAVADKAAQSFCTGDASQWAESGMLTGPSGAGQRDVPGDHLPTIIFSGCTEVLARFAAFLYLWLVPVWCNDSLAAQAGHLELPSLVETSGS